MGKQSDNSQQESGINAYFPLCNGLLLKYTLRKLRSRIKTCHLLKGFLLLIHKNLHLRQNTLFRHRAALFVALVLIFRRFCHNDPDNLL